MLRRAFFKAVMIVPALVACTFGSDDEDAQAFRVIPGSRLLEDGETLSAKRGAYGTLYVDGREQPNAFHARRKGRRVVIERRSEDLRSVMTTAHRASAVAWKSA